MKHGNRSASWTAIMTIAALAALALSAQEYIDPGYGSYVFQLVVGALVGAAVAVKVFWRRILAFLSGRRKR